MASGSSGIGLKIVGLAVAATLYMTRQSIIVGLMGSSDPTGTITRSPVAVRISEWFGLKLSTNDVFVLAGGVAVWAFVIGIVSHEILGERGFNRVVNGNVAGVGLVAGGAFWLKAVGPPGADGLLPMAMFSILCSCGFLLAAAFLKGFLLDEAESFAVGVETRTAGVGRRKSRQTKRRDERLQRIVSGR